ncbi:MAG: hypothetical protein HZB59_09595 [Ignavibacteriales bacterium]|nr:hypothetical protein [Ignavibacteriales bacterium]
MKRLIGNYFPIILLAISCFAIIVLTFNGWNYYDTPVALRAFRPDYQSMKPSGIFSHALGIAGSLMIIIGVVSYSVRKRIRKYRSLGLLSNWLHIHIILCLLGPIFIIYHTTFKSGGIAAITLWTMLSVAISGIIGRFLYVLIPRNLNGTQLTMGEIESEMKRIAEVLQGYPVGIFLSQTIDKSFSGFQPPRTFWQTIATIIRLEKSKIQVRGKINEILSWNKIAPEAALPLKQAALERAALTQKKFLLGQVERFFHNWHLIHLPFTIIMFVTLIVHVVVVILLGYRWIF